MGSHCKGDFHGFIIPDISAQEAEGWGIDQRLEIWEEATCPACGKQFFLPTCQTIAECGELRFEKYFDHVLCNSCQKDAERLFGKETVDELEKDDEHQLVVTSLIEARSGMMQEYCGHWCGSSEA